MYHVVLGVAPEDETLDEKLDALVALPGERRASVVHVMDDPEDAAAVPSFATALDTLRTAGVEASVVPRTGAPPRAVLDVASEVDADCISVAARQRTPAGKRGLRPGAQRIVVTADRPVLVVGDLPENETPRA
jgi:nucleotide-binding universal stress UspA family protein